MRCLLAAGRVKIPWQKDRLALENVTALCKPKFRNLSTVFCTDIGATSQWKPCIDRTSDCWENLPNNRFSFSGTHEIHEVLSKSLGVATLSLIVFPPVCLPRRCHPAACHHLIVATQLAHQPRFFSYVRFKSFKNRFYSNYSDAINIWNHGFKI